jgi:PAS domain S-box-containing protein
MGKWNHSNNFLVNLPISWKITLITLLPLLLMGIVVTITIEKGLNRFLHRELLEDAYAIGNSLAASTAYHLLENDPKAIRHLLDSAVTMGKELSYIYVTGPDRKLIAHTFPQAIPAAILDSAAISREPGSNQGTIQLSGEKIQEITIPLRGGKLGEIHVGLSDGHFQETLSRIRNHILLITLLISIPGLVLILFVIRLITRPLANLSRAANLISQGKLDVKLATSDDEVGQLAMAFNRMTRDLGSHLARLEEAEKVLKGNENLYRTLIDNIDLGITMISKDFEVVLANSVQGRLFNCDATSSIGKKCYEVFEKKSEICGHCPGVKAMRSGRAEEVEFGEMLPDGTSRQVHVRAFPVLDEKREVRGFIEIVSDISTQKHMEEELQRVKNLETIGQLAGGLAHDFNNLLTALIGNIALARADIPPDHGSSLRLEAAENACEQARRLTNQLLTFAKGGMPVKKVIRLPKLLDEACHFTLSGTNLHYVLDAPDNIWPVEIDSNQMNQVIHNLLVNAKESMQANSGGKIFLVAENIVLDQDAILPLAPGRYVKVTIADEGCGIKTADLGKIFHPYFTTKNMGTDRGTGLGLTICHSIIHKHGGHLAVSSEVNRGTSFSIYLPAAEADRLPPAKATSSFANAPSPPGATELRILLLEDDEEVAHIATRYLTNLHHYCEVAATGKEALKMTHDALAAGRPYDLLILDLTIRGGLGGEEMLKRIRQLQPGVPAIVSSGYTGDPIMTDYRHHDFQAALPKPFNLDAVRAAIEEATAAA